MPLILSKIEKQNQQEAQFGIILSAQASFVLGEQSTSLTSSSLQPEGKPGTVFKTSRCG